jgi:hypothetical protein
VNVTSSICVCAMNPHCQSTVGVYHTNESEWIWHPTYSHLYTVPGLVAGCSLTDSVMLSTLQCYYSDCLATLLKLSEELNTGHVQQPTWLEIRPLVFNLNESRFSPETLISTIVQEMMIERWNFSFSYEPFYQACSPASCTYSKQVRPDLVQVMIRFTSLIGGLVLVIRLMTSFLINLIFSALNSWARRHQQQRSNYCSRIS